LPSTAVAENGIRWALQQWERSN